MCDLKIQCADCQRNSEYCRTLRFVSRNPVPVRPYLEQGRADNAHHFPHPSSRQQSLAPAIHYPSPAAAGVTPLCAACRCLEGRLVSKVEGEYVHLDRLHALQRPVWLIVRNALLPSRLKNPGLGATSFQNRLSINLLNSCKASRSALGLTEKVRGLQVTFNWMFRRKVCSQVFLPEHCSTMLPADMAIAIAEQRQSGLMENQQGAEPMFGCC